MPIGPRFPVCLATLRIDPSGGQYGEALLIFVCVVCNVCGYYHEWETAIPTGEDREFL